jgi:hypothetical protein
VQLTAYKGNKKARDEAWARWKKILAAIQSVSAVVVRCPCDSELLTDSPVTRFPHLLTFVGNATLRQSILAFALSLTSLGCLPTATAITNSQTAPPPPILAKWIKMTLLRSQSISSSGRRSNKTVNLSKIPGDDFEKFEDGHKQQISSFAYISNVLF